MQVTGRCCCAINSRLLLFLVAQHTHRSVHRFTGRCTHTPEYIITARAMSIRQIFSQGFGLSATQRPSAHSHRTSISASTSQQAPRRRRSSTTTMFFDFGKKKEESNARPVAGGTVKGGKKVCGNIRRGLVGAINPCCCCHSPIRANSQKPSPCCRALGRRRE